jgi:signal transduction histidine kinase
MTANPAPRRTVRLRLTLLYGGLFVGSGVVLVGLAYLLATHVPLPGAPPVPAEPPAPGLGTGLPAPLAPHPPAGPPSIEPGGAHRAVDVQRLLVSSVLALAALSAASLVLGWVVAGRVLRPIATMTAAVRRISADDLSGRLAATGPDDELKELADTFDALLDRLERSFTAQRGFIANASHELRTPLTLQRTTVEVALADPAATAATHRAALQRVLVSGEEHERIIEALLVLARSQREPARREEVDLATLVSEAAEGSTDGSPIRIDCDLVPARVLGDRELLGRLVTNLVTNAVVHNVPGGWARVSTASAAGRVVLSVANSGAAIPQDEVAGLLEPFRRLSRARTGNRGTGLGLSIVAAIVDAHDGALTLHPRPEGGLDVRVTLPGRPSTA